MKPDSERELSGGVATENLHRAQETHCSKYKKYTEQGNVIADH